MRADARTAVIVGALLRLGAFPFAEDLWSDAPVRSEIAQAWAHAPGLWWSYREVFQFGPLPFHLEGALVGLGLGWNVGPRLVPLVFGICGIALAARLGKRVGAGAFAAWAVALSPAHIQASTTCASEAIFLTCVVGLLLALEANRALPFALWAFAASTTRYDAWLWFPLLAAWLLWTRRPRLAALLAPGPLSVVVANQLALGRPFAPLQHISGEHAATAAELAVRFGAVTWRALAVAFWGAAPFVVLTPLFAWFTLRALTVRGREAVPTGLAAVTPAAVYALRGLTGTFWPLLRMAGPPSLLLATRVQRAPLRACIAVALAFDVGLVTFAAFPNPLQWPAQRATPVSRLPDDLRAAVQALETSPGVVALDESPTWEDITIAHHAHRDRFALYALGRPDVVIAIRGGKLDASLRASAHALGRACAQAGAIGSVSWWHCHDD